MGRAMRPWAFLLPALLFPAVAHAQAERSGPTFSLGGTTSPVELPDIAHDHVNNRFLQVAGKGFIEGHLLNSAGGIISTFRVDAIGDYAQNPRVAFGGDRYLVTWHATIGNFARVRGRLFDANGGALTSDFDIAVGAVDWPTGACWLDGAIPAYSTGSQEFLVAWRGNFGSWNDILVQRVSPSGALLGGNTLVSSTPLFDRDPAVAYNPDLNEFFVAYAVWDEGQQRGYVSGRRVQAGSGAVVGPAPPLPQFGSAGGGMRVPSVSYNTTTQQYLLGWTQLTPFQHVNSVMLTSTGVQTGGLRVLSNFYAAYDALDIDYNQPSNKFLLVTHGGGAQPWEDAAVSIHPDGTPYDNGFFLTRTEDVRPLRPDPHRNDGNFNPRMASSASEPKWLMVTSSVFAAVHAQFAASGSTQPPPPTPNPFMWLDFPTPGTTVTGPWAIGGWAIDAGAPTGTGVSAVHAWATPHAGGAQIFLGSATLGLSRPDVGAAFGNPRFTPSGFALAGVLPPGGYDITVSAFSTVTSSFNISRGTTISVVQPASQPSMYVDLPAVGQVVSQTNIAIAGWAVDLSSASGPGVNAVHVWAYPVAGGNPIFVGPATVGLPRPDVALHFGAARFGDSGYAMQGSLPPGEYDLAVFAFSYIAGSFNNVYVVRIRVV